MQIKDAHYHSPMDQPIVEETLKSRLHHILLSEDLDSHRHLINTLVTDLGSNMLDCASALLYLNQQLMPPSFKSSIAKKTDRNRQSILTAQPAIKMVRYRLEVGQKHLVTLEEIKKVLVEESGVDKNNIGIVDIQAQSTFIELPDEMPHDIFLHLKSVTINQHALDIKRVKNRNLKKRGHKRKRHKKTKYVTET